MSEAPFPPCSWRDIEAYDHNEVVEGYAGWRPDDPEPGPNRSPSFRWGWTNAKRDRSREDDGFDGIRGDSIRRHRPSPSLNREG